MISIMRIYDMNNLVVDAAVFGKSRFKIKLLYWIRSTLLFNSYSNRWIYSNCISGFRATGTCDVPCNQWHSCEWKLCLRRLGKPARSRTTLTINNDALCGNTSIRELAKSRIATNENDRFASEYLYGEGAGRRWRRKRRSRGYHAMLVLHDSCFLDICRKFVSESTIKATR